VTIVTGKLAKIFKNLAFLATLVAWRFGLNFDKALVTFFKQQRPRLHGVYL